VIVDTSLFNAEKEIITGGRASKETQIDIEFGKESGISREMCEFSM
jgi:hypothetical protein